MISKFNALFNRGAENATYRKPAGVLLPLGQSVSTGRITVGKRRNPTTKPVNGPWVKV